MQTAAPANPLLSSLLFDWDRIKERLSETLRFGNYLLNPLKRFTRKNKRPILQYAPEDTLVLRTLADLLKEDIAPCLSKRCTHLKGNGGTKGAVFQGLPKQP